ncbi:MAG: hypothetical protein KF773_16895 [Deltaproteobacteria bacterium]|nr:hypothetical protein [Deltaproteobacteria bacterium]
MAARNWGQIANGTTFEALVSTLVFFEDPGAALFGRRGKDGGQDCRSGDGTLVYQAKHHEDGSAAKAIADARREAAKIADHRKPGASRHREWNLVTRWRLVTNATFNPRDHQTWLDDVVPQFESIGLEATYWERVHLDALLDKHPEVDRSFFGNETRVFLSVPEKRERLPQEEPFLPRAGFAEFIGRSPEIGEIDRFLLSHEQFLVVHGSGGVGKTRLLVEAGEEVASRGEWQVLWANIASLAATGTWFDGVVPERKTLLCIDEPDDAQVLEVVSEQLGGKVGRASQWKVVVAVRSPKDPVVSFLSTPRLKSSVTWLSLDPLSKEAAVRLCIELLRSGHLGETGGPSFDEIAAELVRRFGPYPVWLTLAVHAVESRGNLALVPTDSAGLADLYLDEITHQQKGTAPEQVVELLRWIALAGKLNREDQRAVEVVADGCGTKDAVATLGLIARLVDRRALVQRGINNRLVEVKPDVLRDHILSRWLAVDVGFGERRTRPSDAARRLVDVVFRAIPTGLSNFDRAVLTSIARTELLLRFAGQPIPLLDPFFAAVNHALVQAPASHRIAYVEIVADVARVRVLDTVAVSRFLRTSSVAPESVSSMFGKRTFTQDDVVHSLAWTVYHAAVGAVTPDERLAILGELYELSRAESEIAVRLQRDLPNDGRRAHSLLGQTVAGGKYFWSDYDDAAAALSSRVLAQLATKPPTVEDSEALKSLVHSVVAVERHQAWSEGNRFVWSKQTIMTGHPGWEARLAILNQTRALLEDDRVSLASRKTLWGLLSEAHRLANYSSLHGTDEFRSQMRLEFLDELTWAFTVLSRQRATFEEVAAARDLWEWHARYDKDEELRAAANQCEALYSANELASEFEPLLEFDSTATIERNATAKAVKLATEDAKGIEGFVDRGLQFLGPEKKLFALMGVAGVLGEYSDVSPGVRAFIEGGLGGSVGGEQHVEFALIAASGWFQRSRRSAGPEAALPLLERLLEGCADNLIRGRLLLQCYGTVAPRWSANEMSAAEHAFLRSQEGVFRAIDKLPWFISLIAPSPTHRWDEYRGQIEGILQVLIEPRLTEAVASLIQGVFWAAHKRDISGVPDTLNVWLLDQVLRIASFENMHNMTEWRLKEVIKTLGRVSVAWLPGALRQRSEREKGGGARALSFSLGLSEFVEPIRPENANDQDVTRAVAELLDLVDAGGMVGYRLPELVQQVDPEGIIAPRELAGRMSSRVDAVIQRFARLAKSYSLGTRAWRTIAAPVLEHARDIDSPSERIGLYHAICETGVRSWSGTPGTVPVVFVHEVERARQRRQEESDPRFIPLWDWCLSVAEADLRHQQDRAKEWEENDEES